MPGNSASVKDTAPSLDWRIRLFNGHHATVAWVGPFCEVTIPDKRPCNGGPVSFWRFGRRRSRRTCSRGVNGCSLNHKIRGTSDLGLIEALKLAIDALDAERSKLG